MGSPPSVLVLVPCPPERTGELPHLREMIARQSEFYPGRITLAINMDRVPIGKARNDVVLSNPYAEVIVHFDSDDYHAPDRVARQVAALEESGKGVCGLRRAVLFDAVSCHAEIREYTLPPCYSLAYRRSAWEAKHFAPTQTAEARPFLRYHQDDIIMLDDLDLVVYVRHRYNVTGTVRLKHDPEALERIVHLLPQERTQHAIC